MTRVTLSSGRVAASPSADTSEDGEGSKPELGRPKCGIVAPAKAGASDMGWDFSPDPDPGRPRRDSTAASGVGVGDTANAGSGARAVVCSRSLAAFRHCLFHLKHVTFNFKFQNINKECLSQLLAA